MIDDSMGEAIRAGERARLRAQVQRTKRECAQLHAACDCSAHTYNDAIEDVLRIIDNPAPETRT